MPTVSIIIPCHNRAKLLLKTIDSVLEQTYQDFEIIVVDDASTDDILSELNSVDDPRIHYFRHAHNKGAPAARNTGLAHAQGEYIAFLDSDDAWLPEKLERQLQAFDDKAHDCGIVYCRFLKGETPSRLPPQTGDFGQNILVRNFVGTFSTPLIRRRCFDDTRLMDESLKSCQDWDLWIRMAEHHKFFYIEEPLVLYFPQAVSITRNHQAKYQGLAAIKSKYATQIGQLPRHLKALFHFNIGVDHYWNHDFYLCIRHFVFALVQHPSVISTILEFLFARFKSAMKRLSGKA